MMINRRRALAVLGAALAAGGCAHPARRKTLMYDQELLIASAKGDAVAVRDMLQDGARLEARDSRRRTPLLLAALGDNVETARILVAAGGDPDAQDDRSDSAFLVTGVTGSVPMLDALLPASPDLTLTNRFGGVALIPACERGHVEYVRAVLKTGIKVDHVNRLGWTGLLEAVILGDGSDPYERIVGLLIDAGADVNLADGDGTSPLRHAGNKGQDRIAALLRSAGAR